MFLVKHPCLKSKLRMAIVKKFILLPIISLLSACTLMPERGPSKNAILRQKLPYVVVENVTPHLLDKLNAQQKISRFSQFELQNSNFSGQAKVGDVLEILIWEAGPAILFTANQQTQLPPQVVDARGNIFIPFLGYIHVADQSVESIQQKIINKFKPIANQAQAIVQITQNKSENVTVLTNGSAKLMPLTFAKEKVLDAVASIGGANGKISDISVQMTRGKQVKTLSLETLTTDPAENILLRSGDVITLLNNPLNFTVLGAVGNVQNISFSAKGLSAAEAVGKMGGLDDNSADPKAVFIFRYRPFDELSDKEKQSYIENGYKNPLSVPFVYRFNLTEGDSIFNLQRFAIRDKDVLFVSNAPLAEFNKFLRMIFSPTLPIVSAVK